MPAGVSAHYTTNLITISGTPTASGTFNYSIPLTGGCGSVNATGTITVSPVISGNTSGSDVSICNSTSTTLTGGTATGGSGSYIYLWESSSSLGGTYAPATGTNNTADYTTAVLTTSSTDVYFRRTVTSGGCTSVATGVRVTVMTNPTALSLTGSTICTSPGGTGTITSSTSESGVNYQLKNSSNVNVQSSQAGTGLTLTWSNLAVGAGYYVIATDDSHSCTSTSGTVDIGTYTNPNAPTIGTITQPSCSVSTASVELTDLPFGSWIINPGGVTGSTSSTTLSVLSANITYNFTVTNQNGCTSLLSNDVLIYAAPNCAPLAENEIITTDEDTPVPKYQIWMFNE